MNKRRGFAMLATAAALAAVVSLVGMGAASAGVIASSYRLRALSDTSMTVVEIGVIVVLVVLVGLLVVLGGRGRNVPRDTPEDSSSTEESSTT
ncbi:MAG: hypothetical protein JO147_10550 [Actinobacteria bacterium]|nr:hypothetical protein [Actinomycetota bacterium]